MTPESEGRDGAEAAPGLRITDLHTHVLPAVDDGAQDLGEALEALERLIDEGVSRVVATPHFRASFLERPTLEGATLAGFDAAYEELVRAASEAGLRIEIARGSEFRLDAPGADLSDARLRLGGSRYALVEFASFKIPAYAGSQLEAVREAGWIPVPAHPERYAGASEAMPRIEAWVEAGTHLQVNARSLLGSYGPEARSAARELLRRGRICCLASDYHARGTPELEATVRLLREGGPVSEEETPPTGSPGAAGPVAEEVIETLLSTNPGRILADEAPEPVAGWWVPELDRRFRRGWFR